MMDCPPSGLGLLMGTRLYYSFYSAESDDDAAFEQRIDALCREIGDRGRPVPHTPAAEGVPPTMSAPTPAPAPAHSKLLSAPALASASAPSLGTAPEPSPTPEPSPPHTPAPPPGPAAPPRSLVAPSQNFTPTMQMSSAAAKQEWETSGLGAMMVSERQGLEAKIERLATPQAAVAAEQLSALQRRLEALHATKLLQDEELFALEDIVAEFVELEATTGPVTHEVVQVAPADSPVAKLVKLVALSERIVSEGAFARQVRKHVK